ncbi:MAG TPA: hypothetical protein VJK02_17750 [Anaerolineales bacterium]|nr:hypothetical protein [Anaerolineales bacterium]
MQVKSATILAAISSVLLATLACRGQAGSDTPQVRGTDRGSTEFSDGSFQIDLPDWPRVSSSDETTLIAMASPSGWGVSVGRQPLVPRPFGWYLSEVLPDHGDFHDIRVDDSDIGSVVVEARAGDSPELEVRFVLIYCDGATYQIAGSAPASDFSNFLPAFQTVLDSIDCSHAPAKAEAGNGLVGLILTPPNNDFSFNSLRQTIVEGYDAGVQVTHTYLTWANVEKDPGVYDWTFSDVLMDTMSLEGLRLSLVIEFIHTSVPGDAPEDLVGRSFSDPEYQRRAAAFAAAVAERYGDQLDYLELGNEVNIYFNDHPDELQPFLDLLREARDAVYVVRPDLAVGTVLAFHELMASGRLDMIDTFKIGDFLAYTYYPHSPGFRYDGDTSVFAGVLDRMIERSGDMPFIVVENGWATARSLGGSEGSQAEYIRATFATLAERRGSFGWHLWFGFHDGEQSICEEGGLSFLPPGTDPESLGDAWGQFVDYLCTLGLRQYDGTPKQGWPVFKEELAKYEAGP